MEIKIITIKKLKAFIDSDFYQQLNELPISPHRAISYIHNPAGKPNDPVLYLAMEGDILVGYRLVLPDTLRIDHEELKIGWFSCIWVHPQKRGLGIGKKMTDLALKDWENNIFYQNAVTASFNLYQTTGVFSASKLMGLRGYRRFDFEQIVRSRSRKAKPFYSVIRFMDAGFNFFNDILLRRKDKEYVDSPIVYEIVESIDEETELFIQQHNQNNLFKRNRQQLNWILSYPWILPKPSNDTVSHRYYFSAYEKVFRYFPIKIYGEEKQLKAFVIFKQRGKHLTLPYAFFKTSALEDIVKIMYELMAKYKLNTTTVFYPEINQNMKENPSLFFYMKPIERNFFYPKKIQSSFEKVDKFRFHEGDGDGIFT